MKSWQKKREWEFIVNRAYTPLSLSINSFDTSQKYLDKIVHVPVADLYGGYGNDLYYAAGDQEMIAIVQLDRYKKEGAKFFWHMAEICEQNGERLIQIAQKLSGQTYAGMSRTALNKEFLDFCEEMKSFSVFLNYPFSLEKFLDATLSKIVEAYVPEKSVANEYKKVLSEPIKLNEGQSEQLSLFTIASTLDDKKELEKPSKMLLGRMHDHLVSYAWLPMRWHLGQPATESDVCSRLTHIFNEGNISEKMLSFKKKPEKVEQALKEFVSKYSIKYTDEEMIRLVKEYVFIRTYRTDVINKALFLMIPLLTECAGRLGITFGDIIYFSYDEVSASLLNGKYNDDIRIAERKQKYGFFREGDAVWILSGKEMEEFARTQGFILEDLKNVSEIHGQVGFGGKVKGIVKVVLTPHDVGKVERGDILVTVMTFPSYIVAMERAIAFITDEGGILCHAAIVSREMKKPCIIGTKIATRILKDGDLVEVDANKGIVKILQRAIDNIGG